MTRDDFRAEVVAIGAGVFIGSSPLYGLRRALVLLCARALTLDPRKALLGMKISSPLLAPFLLVAQLQAGAWLRTGRFHGFSLETLRSGDPLLLVLDILIGWLAIGGALAILSFAGTWAALRDSSSEPAYAALVRRAADRYLEGSITSWEFARAKLREDPVFEETLMGGALPSGGTLIDIGCGQGVMLALLIEAMDAAREGQWREGVAPPLFDRLVGIETRPTPARLAASALRGRAAILEGDARDTPFEPCSAVLLFDVLQMMTRQQQEALLSALRNALIPGGAILIREADASAGWRFRRVRIGNRLKVLAGGMWRDPFSFRSREEWIECFRKLGFAAELRPLRGAERSGNLLFRLSESEPLAFPGAGFVRISDTRFRLDPASRIFDGHFEGAPILPGVAHIALALEVCRRKPSGRIMLAGIRELRFLRPLGPGDEVEVAISPGTAGGSIRFEIHAGGEVASTGRLLEASEPDSPPVPRADPQQGQDARTEATDRRWKFGPLPVESLLPHGGSALLLTNVLRFGPDFLEGEGHLPAIHPLVAGEVAPCFLALELGAQAAAALEALLRRERSADASPRIGHLVRIREAELLRATIPAGPTLRVSARLEGAAGPLAIYRIVVGIGQVDYLRAVLSTHGGNEPATTRE